MKVLIVHNDYGKPSGEEAVVARMGEMLKGRGVEVAQLRRSTAYARRSLVGQATVWFNGIWCPDGVHAMRGALKTERPDVVNVHNLYPFISPAALQECRKAGVPVVMTVHNYRLFCPTGLCLRNGEPCIDCLEAGNEWPCVKHNCEGSIVKSVGYAARNAVARTHRHYLDCVDLFACITDFQRRKLMEAGVPEGKLTVIPNCVEAPEEPESGAEGDYVGFCGRASREKGIDLIFEVARRHPEIPFRIAGNKSNTLNIEDVPENVSFTGFLKGEDLEQFYRGARFFVMASRCWEGFPLAIIEAARYRKATIGPDHGGFTEIIGFTDAEKTDPAVDSSADRMAGRLFTPGNADELEQAVVELWNAPDMARALGNNAYDRLHLRYASDVVAARWMETLTTLSSHNK